MRKIVGDGVLPENVASGIARASNIKACKVVVAPNQKKAILCPAAEIDSTHYFHANSKTVFSIDHLTLVKLHLMLELTVGA